MAITAVSLFAPHIPAARKEQQDEVSEFQAPAPPENVPPWRTERTGKERWTEAQVRHLPAAP